MNGRRRAGALAGMAFACLTLAALAAGTTLVASSAAAKPAPPSNCLSGSKDGKIQHVIYLQFDNVHFLRDNPNVPSDLEQMPNLLELPDAERHAQHERPHDPDLPHGRRDPEHAHRALSRPARPGGLELVRLLPAGRLGRVLVELQVLDRHHGRRATRRTARRRRPRDPNFNMVNADPPRSAAPAPSATRRRRGCRSRAPAATSATWAPRTPCSRTTPRSSPARAAHTTLAAAAPAGATSIKVANVGASLAAGLTIILENRTANTGSRSRRSRPSPARPSTSPLRSRTRTPSGSAVTVYSADPTGDMTRVFGAGSPEWNEGRNSQIAPAGTAARNLAQTDFVGMRDPLRVRRRHLRRQRGERAARQAPGRGRRLLRLPGALRREVRQPRDQQRRSPS